MKKQMFWLKVDRGLLAKAALTGWVALAVGASACNLEPSKGTAVTVALPLTCTELEANAGRAMAATFIAVAGAEFPPITEYRNQHPCSGESTELVGHSIATYDVRIPDGDNRALAIAVLGEPMDVGLAGLPDVVVRGIPLRTQTPRPVFFGGGLIVKRAQLEGAAPRIELTLEPFVNLLGVVLDAGVAARARLSFYVPEIAGDGCLATFEDDETTTLQALYDVDTAPNGAFLAAVPYRATEVASPGGFVCDNDEAHGNEVIAFAQGRNGKVALFVPGRAERPGRGLEPGSLPAGTTLHLRSPEESGDPLITGISYVQSRVAHDFYVTGYASTLSDVGTRTVPVTREGDGVTIDVVFEAQKAKSLGEGPGVRSSLRSYSKFYLFGNRRPFVARLSTTRGIEPGAYSLRLGDDATLRFVVR